MRKLISCLIVMLLLAGCSEKPQDLEEPEQAQCTKKVEERIAALSDIWSSAQYYYGYWNEMPEDLLTGEDTVLNAAIEVLQNQIKERTGE
ncbi:hypothetical protein [Holdemania massiliensis]|uniref:hypothetical protein n=1 Tax=Holdemania massiliensis TaxID=1468449 RepID=UPI0035203777